MNIIYTCILLSLVLSILGVFVWLVKKCFGYQEKYETLQLQTTKQTMEALEEKIKAQDHAISNLEELEAVSSAASDQAVHEISTASPQDLVAISNRRRVLGDPFADDPTPGIQPASDLPEKGPTSVKKP